ncbi:MAG: energy-coupling factor ABC transporter substrate-binding protein [Treponema sp.]|nr:energy-coupling factor ABC transporter substrate-binding protein [Treponema sp.]
MKGRTKTVVILIVLAVAISFFPLFMLKGAEFSGSDDAGSNMVNQVTGGTYRRWVSPVLETLIGGELPSEMESFFFCIQTGIGVGVIAFAFGYLYARKKYGGDKADQEAVTGTDNIKSGTASQET